LETGILLPNPTSDTAKESARVKSVVFHISTQKINVIRRKMMTQGAKIVGAGARRYRLNSKI
jgi:hypothetical protein